MGGVMTIITKTIKEQNYGSVMIEDENTNGYYLVMWASKPYAYQEDKGEWALGEIIVHTIQLNPVGKAWSWYTQGKYYGILQFQNVGAANLEL